MLTVTLKNTEQDYFAKLTLESKVQMFELLNLKKLKNESSYVLKQAENAEKYMETNTPSTLLKKQKARSSNWILAIVTLLHIIVISSFISSKAVEVKVIEQSQAMTVSLLTETSKAAEPELQKQVPVKQKQKDEKQSIVNKQVLIKAESVAEVINQQVAQATESKSVSSKNTQSFTKIESEEIVTPHEKIAEEPVTEQEKFDVAYLNNPAPIYPKMSRRQGEQGRVLLKVLVSEKGVADQVQLETRSGFEKLDQAAVDAVKKWSFVPAKRSNQAISTYVLVPVKFSLNN
jgi:protein TonB